MRAWASILCLTTFTGVRFHALCPRYLPGAILAIARCTPLLMAQGQVYAWGHNRVAQLGIGNSFTVPRNVEGACFLPSPQLVESLLGMVR